MRWTYLVVLLLAGCSPMIGAGAGFFGVLLVVGVAFLSYTRASAEPGAAESSAATGAPMPRPTCDGWEHKSCQDGRIKYSCCPKGAKCNYRYAPFQECGYEQCVPGNDKGACPAREPVIDAGKTQAECDKTSGQWAKVCANNQVKMACLPPMVTNYMGPPYNPSFRECGDNRCTTSRFIEDCYPNKAAEAKCLTGWTDVCIEGKLTQKCLPLTARKSEASTGFVKCPDGCAIGEGPEACRR